MAKAKTPKKTTTRKATAAPAKKPAGRRASAKPAAPAKTRARAKAPEAGKDTAPTIPPVLTKALLAEMCHEATRVYRRGFGDGGLKPYSESFGTQQAAMKGVEFCLGIGDDFTPVDFEGRLAPGQTSDLNIYATMCKAFAPMLPKEKA